MDFLRRTFLTVVCVSVCAAVPLVAQATLPLQTLAHSAAPELHTAKKPTSSAPTPTPPSNFIDASPMGSPIVLDKGWRVGVTSDPAVSSPSYDDSGWLFATLNP